MTALDVDRARAVSLVLEDILGWSRYPDPEPLTADWWDAQKERVTEVIDAALSRVKDPELQRDLRRARRLSFEFLGLLFHRPDLSTIPPDQWAMATDRAVYDDLGAVCRRLSSWDRPNKTPEYSGPDDSGWPTITAAAKGCRDVRPSC